MKRKTHKDCHFCGTPFKLFRTTDKFCSPACRKAEMDDKDQKRELKRKSTIAPVSQKRLKQLAEYRKAKKEFMSRPENQTCPVTRVPSTEIHHTNGRENDRLNDTDFWIAVSRDGHNWIHAHPIEARKKGWLI